MTQGLKGKRVLITAAAAGIGRATAEAFLAAGAQVHACDLDQASLEAFRKSSPQLSVSLTDVSDPKAIEALFADALDALGGLDILVNNAGIAGPTAAIEACDLEAWRATLAVNLDATYLCCHHGVPHIKAAGGGAIVNLSSTAGLMGYPFRAPYVAAKWAVIGLSKTLAVELGPHNIRVNALCPGSVDGPRMERVIQAEADVRGTTPEEVRAAYERTTSLRTFVDAEDIANMIIFLCSPAGRRISGQAVAVDGHTESLSG